MSDIRVRFAGFTEREEYRGGFFLKPLFIPAVIALAGDAWVDKRYLRCPHCDGIENLDRFFYAKHHTYYCRHCGEIIRIGTK